MTRLLVRVDDAADAALAAAAKVDIVETGPAEAAAVRAAFPGRLRLDVGTTRLTPATMDAAQRLHADEVVVTADVALEAALPSEGGHGPAVVARGILSERDVERLRGHAAMLMLVAGPGVRLLDRCGIAQLDALAPACRAAQVAFGFAGGLEAPDVSRLLLLRPDVLGFDAAVRHGNAPSGPLDPAALDAIRSLVPRPSDGEKPSQAGEVLDRVFIRDFVVPLSIGAYEAERGRRQRVRFGVEVEAARRPGLPRDMREVFSYDIVVETIRVLAARSHVTFVETLAEEVAASVLAHAAVRAVTVRVEKLDVIEGTVGIEITRGKRTGMDPV